jgi:predicted nucleic acid-binding protein
MKAFLFDTDVLIDHLRGVDLATQYIEQVMHQSTIYLSSITIAELFSGVREGQERLQLNKFLSLFNTVAIDHPIAILGGLFRRDYHKSHGVGLADAIIAASAQQVNATLVTLNKKHFPMISSILVPYQKRA